MEQLIRRATEIGNGAHVFVPKEWTNEEIILVRKPLKEELISVLFPYLEHVLGVYIYGSYARGEETEKSDIDVLVISDKKLKIGRKGKFDIIAIERDIMENAEKINPLLWFSILKEAKAIINGGLLLELRGKGINIKLFEKFIKDTKEAQKSNKELMELDKKTGEASLAAIYSLMLRIRGIFLMNKLSRNQKFSNELFKKWLIGKIPGLNFERIYEGYRVIRDDGERGAKVKISLDDEERLYNLLESEIKKLKKNGGRNGKVHYGAHNHRKKGRCRKNC